MKNYFTKLLPDQIADFWDVIKYAIDQSVPPIAGESIDRMNRILASALMGTTEVWASYTKGEEGNKMNGIVVTQFLYDEPSDTKNLLIYAVYGFSEIPITAWFEGIKKLIKYAKEKKCAQVVAYTNVRQFIRLVRRVGGNADYVFVSFNVNKFVKKFDGLEDKDNG